MKDNEWNGWLRPWCAILVLVLACCGVESVTAQSAVVVPSRYDVLEGPGVVLWAFSPFESRRQLILDESHLGGLRGRAIKALWVRRNFGDPASFEARKTRLKIEMSHARVAAAAATESFALNRGSDSAKVFEAEIVLPFSASPQFTPGGWSAPHAVEIRFKHPFVYKGGPLCIETTTSVKDKELWWPLDAVTDLRPGRVREFGASCISKAGAQPASIDGTGATPGSTCTFFFRGDTEDDEAICYFGFSDQHWGAVPLPFDLAVVGAPGCFAHIDLAFPVPVKLKRFSDAPFRHGAVTALIPNTSAAIGLAVFSQWSVKSKRNRLHLQTSNAARTIVGLPSPLQGLAWIESTDHSADTGRVLRGRFPVLRIVCRGP